MWDKKKDLKERYDSTADHYDTRYKSIQKDKSDIVSDYIGSADDILDVGCGTGLFLEEVTSDGLVVGVDFSEKMLGKAKKRIDSGYLIHADADYLPFKDESFDLVFSLTLLQNMPEPEETLREMRRVTRTGGKVIATALEKKFSKENLREIMVSAGLRPIESGVIEQSEDVFTVGERIE